MFIGATRRVLIGESSYLFCQSTIILVDSIPANH
jgi:hypothetical protein